MSILIIILHFGSPSPPNYAKLPFITIFTICEINIIEEEISGATKST